MADNAILEKKHNIVYKTTNIINRKIYIGVHSTNKLDDNYLGSGSILRKAFRKYGKENFNREILHDVDTSELMYFIEELLVNEDFVSREDTYNIKIGGNISPFLNKNHSLETINRISNLRKGKNPWNKGIKYKQKHSEETKKVIGEYSKLRKNNLGKIYSEETKIKMSNSHVGFTHTQESKDKISISNTGKIRTEEQKRKLSDSHIGIYP